MSAWLETDDVDRLIVKAFQNVDRYDPLDLMRFAPHERLSAFRIGNQSEKDLRSMGAACRRILEGRVDIPLGPHIAMGRLDAMMLARHGISPYAAARLAHEAAGIGIVDAQGDRIAMLLPSAAVTTIHDGDLSVIVERSTSSTIVLLPRCPDTAITAATGGPLSALVSHPVLDAFDLVLRGETKHQDAGRARSALLVTCREIEGLLSTKALRAIASVPRLTKTRRR